MNRLEAAIHRAFADGKKVHSPKVRTLVNGNIHVTTRCGIKGHSSCAPEDVTCKRCRKRIQDILRKKR